jgi:hypothetical protein
VRREGGNGQEEGRGQRGKRRGKRKPRNLEDLETQPDKSVPVQI